MAQDHQFERDRKKNLAAIEIHSRDDPTACRPPYRPRTSGPGQWLVVALTEGLARLTVSQRPLLQVVSTSSRELGRSVSLFQGC
jgi:hypothetical protein